ncbi:MAG: hypothetical protein ACREYF_01295 [Gammaproteobacteria bacterium]
MQDLATNAPLRTQDDLLALFQGATKRPEEFRVGYEMEKFGVYADSLAPLCYDGDRGITRLLDWFIAQGWHADRECPDGPVIAVLGPTYTITQRIVTALDLLRPLAVPLSSRHAGMQQEQNSDRLSFVLP